MVDYHTNFWSESINSICVQLYSTYSCMLNNNMIQMFDYFCCELKFSSHQSQRCGSQPSFTASPCNSCDFTEVCEHSSPFSVCFTWLILSPWGIIPCLVLYQILRWFWCADMQQSDSLNVRRQFWRFLNEIQIVSSFQWLPEKKHLPTCLETLYFCLLYVYWLAKETKHILIFFGV